MEVLKTKFQKKKEERYSRIYNDFKEMIKNPENSKTGIYEYLLEKYGLTSRITIWRIIKKFRNNE
jgi:hypothetical protein